MLNGLKIGWGCQNSDGDGFKILDLLIKFILPKAQYAMTYRRSLPNAAGGWRPL